MTNQRLSPCFLPSFSDGMLSKVDSSRVISSMHSSGSNSACDYGVTLFTGASLQFWNSMGSSWLIVYIFSHVKAKAALVGKGRELSKVLHDTGVFRLWDHCSQLPLAIVWEDAEGHQIANFCKWLRNREGGFVTAAFQPSQKYFKSSKNRMQFLPGS